MPEQLPVDPAAVDPRTLAAALEAAGWTSLGGIPDVYIRLSAPPNWPGSLRVMVPFNPEMADYLPDLAAIVTELAAAAAAGEQAVPVLTAVGAPDPVGEGVYGLFLEATSTPGGWRQATEALSPAAREAILTALLRYARRFNDAADLVLTRKRLAWWDR